ncbi:MAG: hypothetical protein JOZ41_02580, partial [Chloroflexi bacterium]|nr:hypothetical protein [Chloroflexota bacterium]
MQVIAEGLPLRQLVLFKHGVGYFTRSGAAADPEIRLLFRADAVDDALKSLTVFTLDGGRVRDVQYETPVDKAARLEEIPISLSEDHSFFDLLRDLRGTPVRLELQGRREVDGRVLGVEEHPQGQEHGARVALLTGAGTVEQVSTGEIVRLQIEDPARARDLEYYLEASQTRETHRTITIRLDEPGHRVQVSYAAPSPVWRVSYRLLADAAGDGALLQGWGIFDNRLDEDLVDVEVRLVAGQPVSFLYDLTSSVIPERRRVQDEARIAAGPVEFEGALPTPPAPADPAAVARLMRSPLAPMPMGMPPRDASSTTELARMRAPVPSGGMIMRADSLADSTILAAAAADRDELFEYRVEGVSVKRGESAMVPIVQWTGPHRRELLYNGAKHPRHPVVTLRLPNETGLTLERGPVTVVEEGQYRGEAIMPFVKQGAEIVLAFAVELGVKVTESMFTWTSLAAVGIKGAYLHLQEHQFRRTTYTLTNNTGREQVVTVERARLVETVLIETPEPDETTGQFWRWRVTCEPHASRDFAVTERWETSRYEALLDQSLNQLSEYLEHRSLDDETRQRLRRILELRETGARLDRQLEDRRAERRELGERQERLRRNLTIRAENEQEE